MARSARLVAAPRLMKERHIRLELVQEQPEGAARISPQPSALSGSRSSVVRAVGWNLAARAAALSLVQGSLIDLAYRIRENDHPEYGGLEVEIVGIEPAGD